jgi:hypothetical protein
MKLPKLTEERIQELLEIVRTLNVPRTSDETLRITKAVTGEMFESGMTDREVADAFGVAREGWAREWRTGVLEFGDGT